MGPMELSKIIEGFMFDLSWIEQLMELNKDNLMKLKGGWVGLASLEWKHITSNPLIWIENSIEGAMKLRNQPTHFNFKEFN